MACRRGVYLVLCCELVGALEDLVYVGMGDPCRIDMCLDVCLGMCLDMCLDVRLDMCLDMCADVKSAGRRCTRMHQ